MPHSTASTQRNPGQRPEQILEAALAVFGRDGFRAATMDEIARHAGITKGTIYLYFKNKEALFIEVVRTNFKPLFELLPGSISTAMDDSGGDLRAIAKQAGQQYLDTIMQPESARLFSVVIGEIQHLPRLQQIYHDEIIPEFNLKVAELIRACSDAGLFKPLDPVISARCLFGMFFVFVLTQEIFGAKEVTPMETGDIVETIATIYFDGVLEEGDSA